MEHDVRNWLKRFGLHEYEENFEKDGWEKLEDLFHIDGDDLNRCIHKPGHRKRFYLAVKETEATGVHTSIKVNETKNEDIVSYDDETYNDSKAKAVETWLQRNGLGHYFSNFQNEGWDVLEVIYDMNELDISKCIELPGHRMKFQMALKRRGSELGESVMPDILQEKEDVKSWLMKNDLEQYFDRLDGEGWDTMEVLFELGEEDLRQCIRLPGHKKRFQLAVLNGKSKECASLPSGKSLEESADLQMITERKSIAYSQNVFQDMKSDLPTVYEEFVPSQAEPLAKTNGDDKKSFDKESVTETKVQDEFVKR